MSFTTAPSQKNSYRCEGLTPAPSKTQFFFATRGFNTAPSKTPLPPSDSLTTLIYPLPTPLIVWPFSAPIGLGSLNCCPSADSIGFRRLPALAPWAPTSGYTLCVSRRYVVTESGANKTHCCCVSL
ncbi:hypothetical protein TNCV_2340481 [Trichonephila clavipes]|nr:hypothetical protein TNCV_2340481 [Trichonephila clavipes]